MQHRVRERRIDEAVGARRFGRRDCRPRKALQVDEHGVIAVGNHVLVVKIGGAKQVQQGEIAALTLIEAPDLLQRAARTRRHELHPAVLAAIDEPHGAKARRELVRAGPFEQSVPVPADRQRPRLVDDARARGEQKDAHGPAVAVMVSEVSAHRLQRPSLPFGKQLHTQHIDVSCQAVEELGACLYPLLRDPHDPAREHRVVAEHPEQRAALVQRPGETAEALFRRGAVEPSIEARGMELEDQRAGQHGRQPASQMIVEEGVDRVRIEGKRRISCSDVRDTRAQTPARDADDRFGDRPEAETFRAGRCGRLDVVGLVAPLRVGPLDSAGKRVWLCSHGSDELLLARAERGELSGDRRGIVEWRQPAPAIEAPPQLPIVRPERTGHWPGRQRAVRPTSARATSQEPFCGSDAGGLTADTAR